MFQPYTYSNAFRFDIYPVGIQPAVDIACRVPRGKDDRSAECLARVRIDAGYLPVFDDKRIHPCLEMYFSATGKDGVPHVFDDAGKFVCSDMRMCVYQDGGVCSVLAKHV